MKTLGKCTGIAALLAASAACQRPAGTAPSLLPERIANFTAGPLAADAAATRRTYTHGGTHISVTLARFEMSPEQYDSWVRTSTEGFPQAALGLQTADGNGFYQCSGGDRPSCDLLVQLRSGFHIEIRGGGTSSRADVDAIAQARSAFIQHDEPRERRQPAEQMAIAGVLPMHLKI